MGTPFPNPQDGAAAKKSEGSGEEAGQRPSRDRRTSAQKRQQDILAMPGLHTKYEYVPFGNTAGPSGIKQCYRTVKAVKRIPILPLKYPPRDTETNPNVESPSGLSQLKRTKSSKSTKATEVQQPSKVLKKQHSCSHCNKKFSSPGKLNQHKLSHTGELPFKCEHCDKKFNSKFKLVRHKLIHNDTRPFACPSCNKTFHRKDHLANHKRIHNPSKSVYICQKESCKKQYTSHLSYKKHIALHSAEEGNLECKICSKTFENQEDIVYHLKVHAGSRTVKNETDKKFDCSNCGRKFFTAKDVRRHLVVHTGRRDFLCQFCPQKFGRKDHLVRHVKKAHPDKQWQSTTPGTSSTFTTEQLEPIAAETEKDDKSHPKKSKGTTDSTLIRKQISPYTVVIPSIKSEQSLPADISTSQQSEVFHYDEGTETILLPDSEDSEQQQIYIECEEHEPIKHEPIPESIKLEESMFSTTVSKSRSSMINLASPVDPTPSTSKYTDPGQYSNLMYMMTPSQSYPIPDIIMLEEEISYSSTDPISDELRVMESTEDTLALLNQPVDSMLSDKGELSVPSTSQMLPSFNQVFQNAAQSPKPPQHPPK